jgi:hypothetical protein
VWCLCDVVGFVRMYWFHLVGGWLVGRTGSSFGMAGGRVGRWVGSGCGVGVSAWGAFLASRRRLFGLPVVLAYVWFVVLSLANVT